MISIIFFAVAVSLASNASADTLNDAFEACKLVILENLVPADQYSLVEFPEVSEVDWTRGDEFYFAFSSGKIAGGSRSKPDWLTGSMEPSASCIGLLSARSFGSVTVNGKDVAFPKSF